MFDLIIIGGGPAGMTASVYAARKQMKTLIITKEFGGQLMWTMGIENYMGYQFITGPELMVKFEEQVQRFSTNIKYEEAIKLIVNKDGTFAVETDGGIYETKSVIIASGKRPRRLNVPGEEEFTGRGVTYCATCDGPLFIKKNVAVIGGGNSAVQAAVELSSIAQIVYLIARRDYIADPVIIDKMKEASNIVELKGYTTEGIYGQDFVEKLGIKCLADGQLTELEVHGVFVEIGLKPNSEFVTGVVDMNSNNEIIVDCRTCTGIPGLYAAGDVTNCPDKQIVIAAGDGSKAALMAYDYLLRQK
ncbi:NADH dehydrogenase [bioreactor metagenome]|uniref:NADH dehydrogenase n=1 Tax=bioreactor metagenome TaxID=1076179 RepID=A0A644URA5_9ZZZZ|nr:FAD-dependent oxidoreductase [Negativicutes bacterium]